MDTVKRARSTVIVEMSRRFDGMSHKTDDLKLF